MEVPRRADDSGGYEVLLASDLNRIANASVPCAYPQVLSLRGIQRKEQPTSRAPAFKAAFEGVGVGCPSAKAVHKRRLHPRQRYTSAAACLRHFVRLRRAAEVSVLRNRGGAAKGQGCHHALAPGAPRGK